MIKSVPLPRVLLRLPLLAAIGVLLVAAERRAASPDDDVALAEQQPRALTLESLPSPAGNDAAEPFVSVDDKGTAYLSWLERQADSSYALRVATLRAGTSAWSAPREVMRRKDLFVNWADFPSVVPIGEGRLLAHWLQRNGAGTYAYDVRVAESRDGGATWAPSVIPHAPNVQAEHGFVSILPTGKGSASIVLLDGTAGALAAAKAKTAGAAAGHEGEHGAAMQLAHAAWRDGKVVSTQTLDVRTCDCCQTATAMTSKGPVAVYRDRSPEEIRDMSIVRLVNGKWTEPMPVHRDGWKIASCPVNGPAVAAMGDTLATAWFTAPGDSARVHVAFSTDAGVRFAAPVRVDAGSPTGRVDIELLDGRTALVSWLERTGGDSAEVRARVVRRDGTMEPHLVVSPSSRARSSGFPRMARTPDGVVLAWTLAGRPSVVKAARIRVGAR